MRLQKVTDSRHSDDYNLNRALRARLRVCLLTFIQQSITLFNSTVIVLTMSFIQGQKRKVAEEEVASRKLGLGIRLLPPSTEDGATAAKVKFASKFEKNMKDKRAAIKSSSIFASSITSPAGNKLSELESKRRKIKASTASALLTGRVKPSSWVQQSHTSLSAARSGRNSVVLTRK